MKRIALLASLLVALVPTAALLAVGAGAGSLDDCAIACGHADGGLEAHACCPSGGDERGAAFRTCPRDRVSPLPSAPAIPMASAATLRLDPESLLEAVSPPPPLSASSDLPDPVPLALS